MTSSIEPVKTPTGNPQTPSNDLFDRKFVAAASLIGCVYCLVVVAIGQMLGSQAAGVAGVALSVLATGIFTKFQSLRFQQVDPSHIVQLPRLRVSYALVITFAFVGSQFIVKTTLNLLMTGILNLTGWQGTQNVALLDLLRDSTVLWSSLVINIICAFFAGLLIGISSPHISRVAYNYVAVGALFGFLAVGILPSLGAVLATRDRTALNSLLNPVFYAFILVYILTGLAGAALALRHQPSST